MISKDETRNLSFAFDIGVASCGWAVVDMNSGEILEAASNIFECADASENEKRRGFRGTRRLIRRRRTRIMDFQKLWHSSGFSIPEKQENTPLSCRVRGLNAEISLDDFYWVLHSMLKHRGISYLEETDEENSTGKEYAQSLAINQKELKSFFPCEIQMKRLESYGGYRGQRNIAQDEDVFTISNVFTTSSYRKELVKLFETQRSFHIELTEKFQKAYLEIFDRKRAYYIGPGNEKSRTDYGVYTTGRLEDGTYRTDDNLFAKLIGKCSVYPEELRASAASYTAQEYNVLNDLNNLTINGRKLEEQEKRTIVENLLKAKQVSMRAIIKKAINEDIVTFEGARVDKNEKELFHSFECYRKMRNYLSEQGLDIKKLTTEELDEIGHVLTLNTERDSIVSELNKLGFNDDVVEALVKFRYKNGSQFKKWHSFSIKLMQDIIPTMYEQPKEQQTILSEMGVFKTSIEKYKELESVPVKDLENQLYNPVVVRSVRVTIRVLNALLKKYGAPSRVVIEMPRDKNSEEEKERIKKNQNKNEKELNEIVARIKNEYGIELKQENFRQHKELALKLKLWNEQDGKCLYSGRSIPVDELIHNQHLFEVDHIIPLSVSLDDSRANKTLCYHTENQNKKARTPYGYLRELTRPYGWNQFEAAVKDLKERKRIDDKKLRNYLFTQDITRIDVLKGFISRNLNDTRYASRVVLNVLSSFFKAKNTGTIVVSVRGKFTDMMRKNLTLKKNREESYVHHAEDAMLLCYSQMGYEAFVKLQGEFIDFETGELLDTNRWEEGMSEYQFRKYLYAEKWAFYRNTIQEAKKSVKYWYQIDRKCNRGLCNQTIYGTRVIDGKVMKISRTADIRTKQGLEALKKHEDTMLMKKNDPVTWEQLKSIIRDYSSITEDGKTKTVNPFVQYEKETGDCVRKYSRKHDGPVITKLSYVDGEVNSCIDISHKYGMEKGSKKVILESLRPYRMDVYYNDKTKQYSLIGIKYNDIRSVKGGHIIDEEAYVAELIREKVLKNGQTLEDLPAEGYSFYCSFYKNEFIKYQKEGKVYVERFLSRTMPAQRNYIETKPMDANAFSKQHLVGLSKATMICKIRTDILGNCYTSESETFSLWCD